MHMQFINNSFSHTAVTFGYEAEFSNIWLPFSSISIAALGSLGDFNCLGKLSTLEAMSLSLLQTAFRFLRSTQESVSKSGDEEF